MLRADKEIIALLPEYINGALSEEDAAEVERAAASNEDIAAEIDTLRNVASALKSAAPDNNPGELGWARLSRAIEAEEAAASRDAFKRGGVEPAWRYAAFALAAIVVGQTAWLASNTGAGSEPTYGLASETTDDSLSLRAMFVASAPQSAVADLLKAQDGQIVGGPSAIGLFEIRFPSEQARDEAAAVFRTRTDVVSTVQTD